MDTPENRMKLIFGLRQAGISDQKLLSIFERVDRSAFLSKVFVERSGDDVPLPIECGQTISAPSVVAKMTRALDITPKSKVLEIGTGSGYQTAILAHLARRVYSIERQRDLARIAEARIEEMGLRNVTIISADGSLGLPHQAPFDRIIVTAAAEDPPSTLLAQLAVGGIMVLPVGQSDAVQTLIRVYKTEAGLDYEEMDQVRFVPLLPGRA